MGFAVRLVMLASIGAMLAASVAQAQMYRWTDEEGRVHYSDSPPPEASRQERQILDERGLRRGVLERARTPEEIEEARRQEQAEEERRQAEAERERRDRILLQSFGSERELIAARDDRVALIDGALHITEENIRGLEEQKASLERRRDLIASRGREPPEALDEDIASVQRQIRVQEQLREERTAERRRIIEQFDADLERLRELLAER
ncbi:hypothetical protein B1C78_06315 [Thioalkalivibrio denitrificans]|uniref:DUF4124 domain-containing protein n=1 Tax=Thioalkalivibrio denitrificans TaxID=108003 RepID=A0A1V3NKX5_9GAMM|nr:DUF4124 domain-containing protein [Thioalkalivibrio denitrificans]OOG25710.1 hypothetical protein B1C78_06315 [Thioalkalivibrio denitrificans]